MKHRFAAVLLILSLLLSMTGCSASGVLQQLDAAEDRVEEKLDAAGDSVEKAIRGAVAPADTAPSREPAAPSTEPVFTPVTKEGAEQIALDYLQLSRDQVKRLRTEYEIDDGICLYDVQFLSGDWEYEFEISAENGRILSYDKDSRYD